MADLSAPPLTWSRNDQNEMKPGVGERRYELDSLCYPIRLAYGYWKQTGGPYHFQRAAPTPTETLDEAGFGNPVNPVGLIASGFRTSDDACIFPFLVPSNLFAVTCLRQLAEMANEILHDSALASEASALAAEVETALRQYAVASTPNGTIWATKSMASAVRFSWMTPTCPACWHFRICKARQTRSLRTHPRLRVEQSQPLVLPWFRGPGRWRTTRGQEHDLAYVTDRLRIDQHVRA